MNKKVKKVIGISILIFTLIVIGGVVVLFMALNSIVAEGVRTFGTQATGTRVELQSVNISPFNGSVELKGMYVANPQDCQSKNAFVLGHFYVDMKLASLFTDKIIINNIIIEDIAVDFEPSVSKGSNLHEIKNNILRYCGVEKTSSGSGEGTGKKEPAAPDTGKQKPGKKVMIKYFVIKNGTISVSSSILKTSANLPMPKIEMRDIGADDNKSAGDVLQEIFDHMLKGIGTAVSGVQGIKLDSVNEDVAKATENVGKGVKDSFKSLKSSIGL
ncbi:MAG: hypothetical protein WCV67_14595 [Victivallaceae bacterium]